MNHCQGSTAAFDSSDDRLGLVDVSEGKRGAVDIALERLRAIVRDGEVGAYGRLPTEPELCARIGVSRGSLREAVRTLITVGILETRQGSGTFVTGLQVGEIIPLFETALDVLPANGVLHLLEMRRVTDSFAAAQAASVASDELLDRLESLLLIADQRSGTAVDDSAENEFHDLILEAANSPAIAAFGKVFRRTAALKNVFSEPNGEARHVENKRAHHAILAALRTRDPFSAQAEMYQHIRTTESWIRTDASLPL